jgi:N-acetylneuraminic acid mutarotase
MEASVIDDKIYVISGMADISKPTLSSSNWVYDPSSNSWSSAASIPTSVFNYASAVVDNKIYVEGGGLSGSPYYCNLNQIYDPKTNTWTLGEPLPVMVHNGAAGATTGVLATAKLYVIGGTNDGIHGVDTVQIYDSQTGNWTLGAQMPTARLGLAVAVSNDTLYALGGISSAGPQNNKGAIYAVNEQYIPLDYQGTIPSPYIPTPSPRSTSTPTPTPTTSPNFGPTSSPTPSPSIPEFSSLAIPLLFTVIVAAGLLVYRKKHKTKATQP